MISWRDLAISFVCGLPVAILIALVVWLCGITGPAPERVNVNDSGSMQKWADNR